MKEGDFYYTTDYGEKVYVTNAQAEEIFRQREAYYKACDMQEMIKDEFSDNKQLMKLTTGDLLKYVHYFEEQLEMGEDMDAYWNTCRTVIEDYVMKDLGVDENEPN